MQLGWQTGDEGNILVTEPLGTSKLDRERMTQLMFEEFNVAGLFMADQPVLSLYALGKLTGCVIDIGHGKTGTQRSPGRSDPSPVTLRSTGGPSTLLSPLPMASLAAQPCRALQHLLLSCQQLRVLPSEQLHG